MANYTDSTLNMKVHKDKIIISDPILVPDSGWITNVYAIVEFCGVDSMTGESVYQSEVRYFADEIFIHDAAYIGGREIGPYRLEDTDVLNYFYRGKLMYLQFDAWAVLDRIQNAADDWKQRYPSDYIKYVGGYVTFTYSDYAGQVSDFTCKINIGGQQIGNIYLGSTKVNAIYLGTQRLMGYQSEPETQITYSFNPDSMEITVNLIDMDEKMQNRFDEGRLYLSIYAKDRQAQSQAACFKAAFDSESREDLYWMDHGNCRGQYKRMNKLIARAQIETNPFTICFDDFSFMDLHSMRRYGNFDGYIPDFVKFQAALHFYCQNADYFDAVSDFKETGPLRMVPNSLSKMFNYNFFSDNDPVLTEAVRIDSTQFTQIDGYYLMFKPSYTISGYGVSIGDQYQGTVKYTDEYGSVKYYYGDDMEFCWIKTTDTVKTSNIKPIADATPIPPNTPFYLVVHCPSGHMESISHADIDVTIMQTA